MPAIGCDCRVCLSADPKDNRLRTGAAVMVTDDSGVERTILLDTGPDLRQQVIRFGIRRCDAILFTHNHVDHTFGLDEVRRFNAMQQSAIDLYAEEHTLEHLHRVYKHIFEKSKNTNDSFVATLIAHRINSEQPLSLFGLKVTPLRFMHGRLPILGFRFDVVPGKGGDPLDRASGDSPFPLAYCTDVSAIPPETWPRLRGLRTLVLDALRHRHHPTHFTLSQAVNAASQIAAGRTYFVHMSHDLHHEETQAELPEGMYLAWDGLELR